jgi:hypothetical protein
MRRRALLAVGFAAGANASLVRGAAPNGPRNGVDFELDLPEGYIGPAEYASGASLSRGYRKPYAGTALSTVILITVHQFGPSVQKRPAGELAALTRSTLDEVVAGIEKNRTRFRKGDARAVTIGGYGGLKLAWSGVAQGIAFEGTVYSVLAGSRAIAVQIQNPVGRGDARMAEAVRAVEGMRISR